MIKNLQLQCLIQIYSLKTLHNLRVDLWKALLVYSASIIGKFNQMIYKLVSQICIRMGTYTYLR